MSEKFWSKSTWLTVLVGAIYVVVATGIGTLIVGH